MTTITPIGPAPGVGPVSPGGPSTARGTGGGPAFTVPTDLRNEGAGAPPAAMAVGGMLMLQEQELDRVKDREARRRGQDALALLRALQAAILAGRIEPSLLDRVRAMASGAALDCEPGLRDVLSTILLRVRVELARHQLLR